MDVIALAQMGIRNAVATLGTATSARHLARIFRAVSKWYSVSMVMRLDATPLGVP